MSTAGQTRVAIVTGAAQGLGEAIALRLADDGLDVAVNDIHAKNEALQAVVANIRRKGRRAVAIAADVSSDEQVKEMVATVVEQLGGVDVVRVDSVEVVNLVRSGFSRDSFCRLKTVMLTVDPVSRSLAQELAQHNITVNSYAPGLIITEMEICCAHPYSEQGWAFFTRQLGGFPPDIPDANPDVIASIVSYIAKPEAYFITDGDMAFHLRTARYLAIFIPRDSHQFATEVHVVLSPALNKFDSQISRTTIATPRMCRDLVRPVRLFLASPHRTAVMSTASTSSVRVALVTGAAQGLGFDIALRLADDGLDVAVNDIASKSDALRDVVKEIRARGRRAVAVPADVSSEEEVKRMIATAVEELGGLDVVRIDAASIDLHRSLISSVQMVANAGIAYRKPLLETSVEEWDRTMAIDVRGVMLCYKYAAFQMIKQGRGGRIIGACSNAGKRGRINLAAYSAAKFAVRGLTQSASQELATHKITVNAYAPGFILTPLDDPEATPEVVASVVSYLAKLESYFVNGVYRCPYIQHLHASLMPTHRPDDHSGRRNYFELNAVSSLGIFGIRRICLYLYRMNSAQSDVIVRPVALCSSSFELLH
ncbi:hypothetical protein B0H21DRAFT_690827 [Amylocystis lapponica]|nr:hypothetical protein B0H21DRAFT_690827 [Amylocystis lapponica]